LSSKKHRKHSLPLGQDKTVRTDGHLYEELKHLKKENARLMEGRYPPLVAFG